MTTVSDLIETTKRWVHGSVKSEMDVLAASCTSAASTITVTDEAAGIVKGAHLGLGDEVLYVRSVASATVTVLRGQLGTTAASHAADAVVEVQPRFPRAFIKDALRDEIAGWDERVFATETVEAEASSSYRGQGLNVAAPDGWYRVLQVVHAPDSDRTGYDNIWERVRNWRVVRDGDTDDYSDGVGIIIQESVPSADIRVTFAKPFDVSSFDDETDLEATVGLSSSMVDIPPLGAAWRLLSTREIPRTDTRAQGVSRHAEQVPPGHTSGAAQGIKRLRDERLDEEHERLLAHWVTLHR